jgi:excisionase family DNA binding protein
MSRKKNPHPLDPATLTEGLPALVPAQRAADFLGVTDRTLRTWARRGRIRVLRTAKGGSGRVLVPRAELERVLELMLVPDSPGGA